MSRETSLPWLGAGGILVSASSPLLDSMSECLAEATVLFGFVARSGEVFFPPCGSMVSVETVALRFVKRASVTVAEVPTLVLSETRGLELSWVVRGGIECLGRLGA